MLQIVALVVFSSIQENVKLMLPVSETKCFHSIKKQAKVSAHLICKTLQNLNSVFANMHWFIFIILVSVQQNSLNHISFHPFTFFVYSLWHLQQSENPTPSDCKSQTL